MRVPWRILACLSLIGLCCAAAWGQTETLTLPELNLPDIKIEPVEGSPLSPALQTMFLMTSLGLIPYFMVSCTAWIRLSITLSYLKSALGSTQALSNQLMMGICISITLFIMYPVGQRINETAVQPYLNGEIKQSEFREKLISPMREWMFYQTRNQDIQLFLRLGRYRERPKTIEDIPFAVMYSAFIISEVKTGFCIGFMIYVPFLIIDMIVAATMMSMGMFMISSSTISLPFKLLMWVRIDGWHVIIRGVLKSFNCPPWMSYPSGF